MFFHEPLKQHGVGGLEVVGVALSRLPEAGDEEREAVVVGVGKPTWRARGA